MSSTLYRKTFYKIKNAKRKFCFYSANHLLRESQCKIIVNAFDMDDDTNEHVRRGHQNLAWLADKYGFIPKRIVWNRQYKGIDDFLQCQGHWQQKFS